MADCRPGCGMCCDPVKLRIPPEGMSGPSGPFARKHWTLVAEWATDQGPEYHVRCDRFDSHTRRCLAYDDRPPICSGYPWYDRAPSVERAECLDLVCSYQGDVRTVLPIARITHGR